MSPGPILISPAADVSTPGPDAFEQLMARHHAEKISIPANWNGTLLDVPGGVGAKYVVNYFPPAPLIATANAILGMPDAIPNPRLWSVILTNHANEALWAGEAFTPLEYCDPYADDATMVGAWGRITVVEALTKLIVNNNKHAEQKVGIALGFNPDMPNIPAAPSQPIFAVYLRGDTMGWELLCAQGNAGPRVVIPLTSLGVAKSDVRNKVKLLYNPIDGYVAAMVNRRVADEVMRDRTKFPLPGEDGVVSPAPFGATMFIQSGGAANPTQTITYVDNLCRTTAGGL